MKKNLLLSFADLLCGFLSVLIGFSFALSTEALIYWHINPDFYTFLKEGNHLYEASQLTV